MCLLSKIKIATFMLSQLLLNALSVFMNRIKEPPAKVALEIFHKPPALVDEFYEAHHRLSQQ